MVKQKTPLFIALALLMYMYGLSLFTTRPRKASGVRSEEEEKSYITFHKHTVYSYIKGLLMQKTFLLNCIPFAYSPSPLTLSVRSLPINYAPQKILWSKKKRLCRFSQTHSLLIFQGFTKIKLVRKCRRFSYKSVYLLLMAQALLLYLYALSPSTTRPRRPLEQGQRKKKKIV